CMQGFQLPRTF
nr:immunoglobulin light chain junction region [Macaca mulatta]